MISLAITTHKNINMKLITLFLTATIIISFFEAKPVWKRQQQHPNKAVQQSSAVKLPRFQALTGSIGRLPCRNVIQTERICKGVICRNVSVIVQKKCHSTSYGIRRINGK
uniref:Uncharacterized protein n=1 Tax=Clytia hemisphaerica TaxID=252671 RepID=A0A7M5V4W5_9CNID